MLMRSRLPAAHAIATQALGLLVSVLCTANPAQAQHAAAPAPTQDCAFAAKPGGTAKAQALAQEIGKTNPCATVPGLKARSLSAVWSAMLSSSKTGGKRFDAPPPADFPSGKLMAGAPGIVFNLKLVADEGVLGLQVSQGGTLLLNIAQPAPASALLPLAQLRPGASYDWTLTTRKSKYRASFELLEADEAAAVQAQLKALAAAELSPPTRLLYLAAIYDEAELYAARDQVLDDIRRQLAP